jgi:hypothetical protein
VGKGDTMLFLLMIALAAIGFGTGVFLPGSVQAEVIDYEEFHTRRQSALRCSGPSFANRNHNYPSLMISLLSFAFTSLPRQHCPLFTQSDLNATVAARIKASGCPGTNPLSLFWSPRPNLLLFLPDGIGANLIESMQTKIKREVF